MIWMLTMLSFVRWLEGREDNKVQVKKKKKEKKNYFFQTRSNRDALIGPNTSFFFLSLSFFFLFLSPLPPLPPLPFLIYQESSLSSLSLSQTHHGDEEKKRRKSFLKEQQEEQSQPASTVPRAAYRSWECHHHVKRVLNYPFKSCGVFSRVSIGWVWMKNFWRANHSFFSPQMCFSLSSFCDKARFAINPFQPSDLSKERVLEEEAMKEDGEKRSEKFVFSSSSLSSFFLSFRHAQDQA